MYIKEMCLSDNWAFLSFFIKSVKNFVYIAQNFFFFQKYVNIGMEISYV